MVIIFSISFLVLAIDFIVYLIKVGIDLWKLGVTLLLIIIIFMLCSGGVTASAHEYTPEDVVLIGKLIQHEAPNESELGQRLVIDTVLNRVESPNFPNSVKMVLAQPGQYCTPREYPPTDVYRLVAEEIYLRTNNQVLWYRTKRYHRYGTPITKEGAHYFSGGIE